MRITTIAILGGIALFLSFTASAQKVVEGTLGRIKDRPLFLGFFVPDGAKPIPGILVSRDSGYFLMFHEDQAPGLSEGATGYFCLPPNYYHDSIAGVTQKGTLKYIAVDAEKLGASEERAAGFAEIGSVELSGMCAAVPRSAEMADEGNLKLDYRLLRVKKKGDAYRILDFMYTRTVLEGVYPLFGRTSKEGTIVALGYIDVAAGDWGSLISVLP